MNFDPYENDLEDLGLDDLSVDKDELERGDILLPVKNQGQNLAKETTPKLVQNPETGKETQPDSSYVSKLRSLSGLTAPNRMY